MAIKIFYFVVKPGQIVKRYGNVVTLNLWQDNNMAQLDSLFGDCIQIYPRPGQPEDPDKVVIKVRFGDKIQQFLADQCGVADPFSDATAIAMLDVYVKIFGSLETLKADHPDLDGTIQVEYLDEDGETQTKEIPIMWEEHVWAGDI